MKRKHFSHSGLWIWTSIDSVSKYLLGMHADERDHRVGDTFIESVVSKFRNRYEPYYMTDGYTVYTKFIRKALGARIKRVYKKGGWHTRKKFYGYVDGVNYGQVVKTREGMKLEKVEYINVTGNVPKEYFNTASVERMNLTIRNCMARMKRISQTFSKDIEDLRECCQVFRMVYNFCRPHMSLSKGKEKVTPAMALGVTDKVWTIGDMMAFSFRENIRL